LSPTLLEVGGSGLRGWVGWRMGWALGRLLGPATTLRVMRALRTGAAEEAYALPDAVVPPAPEPRGPNPLTLVRSREVTGEDLAAVARRTAANVDVRNLAGAALSTAAEISAARPTAFVHTLRDGSTVRAVVYRVSSTRILAHHLFSEPPGRKAPSLAKLWQLDGARSVLINASEGGRLWRETNPRTRAAVSHPSLAARRTGSPRPPPSRTPTKTACAPPSTRPACSAWPKRAPGASCSSTPSPSRRWPSVPGTPPARAGISRTQTELLRRGPLRNAPV
jgi:hypothetical protein